MAQLVLGPLIRYVDATRATVWVETDAPCEVEVLGSRAHTFRVEGRHYALVVVDGLTPNTVTEYEIRLDGERRWPEDGSPFPPSTIRTVAADGSRRIAFGSCRMSLPHRPPYTLSKREHPRGHGVDALHGLARQMTGRAPDEWPDLLLLLGDQVYADDISPALQRAVAAREDRDGAPDDQLADFVDYAHAYGEAWSDPPIRWLLSTVATAMVFDDHEIHAEWKISQDRMEKLRAQPWYDRRVTAGLMAYWLYQHAGNLTPEELAENELLTRLRSSDDGGPLLREFARDADRQPGASRWSFCRDVGPARLVVIDSRAGRELTPGRRAMVDDGEWEWIVERCRGEADHVLLASSVPFVLSAGLHHAEAWNEAVCDGAWGRPAARLGERIRRAGVFDHWASFQASFRRLADLLEALAAGRLGRPPATVVMLSGDVHHSYLAAIDVAGGATATRVWQAVCSPYRKELSPKEKLNMRIGNSRVGAVIGRALAAAVRVPRVPLEWRIVEPPSYDNHVAILRLDGREAALQVETTAGADWQRPELRLEFQHRLTPRA